MANTPAARARRKQARKNYLSDSSFYESSSTSTTHSSRENLYLSHRKKRTNRARACALAARKVSIDNDDENPQKKAADPVMTLKLNVETKPGMFIFNSFKAFLGLGKTLGAEDLIDYSSRRGSEIYKQGIAALDDKSLTEGFNMTTNQTVSSPRPSSVAPLRWVGTRAPNKSPPSPTALVYPSTSSKAMARSMRPP